MKVLVVDDVGYMRHLLQRLLEQNGYSVVTAPNGTSGLKTLEHDTNIDAVVCDLLMPDIDGIEFFRQARMIERVTDEGNAPPIPIILITALRPNDNSRKSDVDRFRQAAEMGFEEIMLKPVDQTLLIHTLRKIELGNSQSEGSDTGVEKIQESFRSLQKATESAENLRNKEALLATLQTLEPQLAGLESGESTSSTRSNENSENR